jgi:hypothetical protein
MIARSVDLRNVMQKESWCFGAWDPCRPNMSKLSHHAERRTLKEKRTNITGCAGALMDLIIPRSAGCSGYTDAKKGAPGSGG